MGCHLQSRRRPLRENGGASEFEAFGCHPSLRCVSFPQCGSVHLKCAYCLESRLGKEGVLKARCGPNWEDWVAVKELKLRYPNSETKLFGIYPCYVIQFKFLNSKTEKDPHIFRLRQRRRAATAGPPGVHEGLASTPQKQGGSFAILPLTTMPMICVEYKALHRNYR